MTTRILVADDYEPWRRFVASLVLFGQPQWRIVGEASDGAEIVRKAKELQPDLVLLDIRMPEMNGFEAARQIVKIVPGAKNSFLKRVRLSGNGGRSNEDGRTRLCCQIGRREGARVRSGKRLSG